MGRDIELETLHQQLRQRGRVVIYSEQTSPGKTELVRHYAQLAWEKQVYPGGVCWLEGQGSHLGYEVVDFAKSKLGLQPPEGGDLQSQVNYCWSHWLKGDVLIVLNGVEDYQHVKSYLPPCGQRFKLVITTPQLSLDKSFSSGGFEGLCLERLKRKLIDDSSSDFNGGKVSPLLRIIVTLLLLFCSGVSLYACYVWADSSPWKFFFTRDGWIIELFRSFIFLFAENIIVFSSFRKDAIELFCFKKVLRDYKAARTRIFVIWLALTLFGIIFIPIYHRYLAPEQMEQDWKKWISENPEPKYNSIELDSDEGFKAYVLPYQYYLPYSLINYIIVWLPVVLVTAYSAVKDFICLKAFKRDLISDLEEINKLKEQYNFFFYPDGLCKKVENTFADFSQSFIEKIGKYTYVFFAFTIGVSFETLLGYKTLAKTAILWLAIGYCFWLITPLSIVLAYKFYEEALNFSIRILRTINCANVNVSEFKNKNKVFNFVCELFERYLIFYICIIIITFVSIIFLTEKLIDKLQ
ncbi:MAG: hypothetical protein F6J94_06995 [Moorea sp. SIO1F2]|uniref:hypothetical protein n=1 Tax=unclassified Moorena TaxID=2683338 RepID=UPI0013B9334D|nr:MULTISPECIES: hypothetical protein [unclassified Moorena]NEP27143.1 hypothetical protein [Moorena sp. SIO3I6]NET81710.1 hypothetical protein [Moorena sp. SIO1F2]